MSILDPNTIGVCITPAQWKLIKNRRAQRQWRERNLERSRAMNNACSKKWWEKNREVANARARERMRRLRANRKALYGKTYLCA